MNEDERGITPANVTSISVDRSGPGWLVVIEQGNGTVVKTLELTEMERMQLGLMLDSDPGKPPLTYSVSFVDFGRTPSGDGADGGPGVGVRWPAWAT